MDAAAPELQQRWG